MKSKIFLTLLSLSCAFTFDGLNASSMSTNKYTVEFTQNKSNLKAYALNRLNDFAIKLEGAGSGDLTHGTVDSILRDLTQFVTVLEDYAGHKEVLEVIMEITDEYEEVSEGITELSPERRAGRAQELYAHVIHNMEREKGPWHSSFVNLLSQARKKIVEGFERSSMNQSVQSDVATLSESGASFVDEGFKALKIDDFKQGSSGSACVLYSFLYAVQQHHELSKRFEEEFLKRIAKTPNGEYFIKYDDRKVQRYDEAVLSKLDETLHPSKNNIIRVIGSYTLDRMRLHSPDQYFLADMNRDHKDFFFNQNVINLKDEVGANFDVEDKVPHQLKEGEFVYKKDGTVEYKKAGKVHKISGDFVVSTGSKGHAVSVFYRNGKWVLFDNLEGEFDLNKSDARLNPSNVYQVLIIGHYKKEEK